MPRGQGRGRAARVGGCRCGRRPRQQVGGLLDGAHAPDGLDRDARVELAAQGLDVQRRGAPRRQAGRGSRPRRRRRRRRLRLEADAVRRRGTASPPRRAPRRSGRRAGRRCGRWRAARRGRPAGRQRGRPPCPSRPRPRPRRSRRRGLGGGQLDVRHVGAERERDQGDDLHVGAPQGLAASPTCTGRTATAAKWRSSASLQSAATSDAVAFGPQERQLDGLGELGSARRHPGRNSKADVDGPPRLCLRAPSKAVWTSSNTDNAIAPRRQARRRRRQAEGERLRRTHRRRRGLALGVLVVPSRSQPSRSRRGDNRKGGRRRPATTARGRHDDRATAEKSEPLRFAEPDVVRGVRIDFVTAGNADGWRHPPARPSPTRPERGSQLDVKDERGRRSASRCDVALAKKIGAVQPPVRRPQGASKKAHEAGLYTIARIVVFQDPILGAKGGELALERRAAASGRTAADSAGRSHRSPRPGLRNRRRRWPPPTPASTRSCTTTLASRTTATVDTAAYAGATPRRTRPSGLPEEGGPARCAPRASVSAAIFAIQATSQAPMRARTRRVEGASSTQSRPMVYPSHFAPGNFDLPSPVVPAIRHGHSRRCIDWRRDMVNGKRAAAARGCRTSTYTGWTTRPRRCSDQIRAANNPGAGRLSDLERRWPSTPRRAHG